jgi:hypothetical protein
MGPVSAFLLSRTLMVPWAEWATSTQALPGSL